MRTIPLPPLGPEGPWYLPSCPWGSCWGLGSCLDSRAAALFDSASSESSLPSQVGFMAMCRQPHPWHQGTLQRTKPAGELLVGTSATLVETTIACFTISVSSRKDFSKSLIFPTMSSRRRGTPCRRGDWYSGGAFPGSTVWSSSMCASSSPSFSSSSRGTTST